MMHSDLLHFIRPLWLLALPLAVIVPWLWRRSRRPSGDWERVCDLHLLRWLSHREAQHGDRSARLQWLAGAALALAIVALAGPSWQQLPDGAYSARDARVIALDLSESMLAADLRPDRLTRARFRLADLLNELQEGQTGLVAYAGDAYVVSPLTTDTHTIANLLPALRPDVMPVSGSRADLALGMAATLLQRAGFSHGEILLVSDAATAADAAKARELHDRGIITSVLAVGTAEGAPIPSGGGFVSDRNGNVVIARLDAAQLRDVAAAGGGRFSQLGSAAVAHESPWRSDQGTEFTRREDSLDRRWKDAGPWLVLVLLPLALAGFRKGVLFLLPLCLLAGGLYAPPARAGWWDDLWERRDQQAWQALSNSENDRAAALAVDPGLSGEAWYRTGKYDNALGAWSRLDGADAHYNKGNALAQLGEFDAALQAYDQALELDPDMDDARFNRELVEKMKRQQQEQEQQQDGDGQPQDGESSAENGQDKQDGQAQQQPGEQNESEQQQEGEQQADQNESEQGDKRGEQPNYAQSWSEEDAQAMEQWLRRIPDDPGGLLRRKFMNEHQRRGAPRDESEPW
jgi:Ca-activated chloride channel family protein